MNSQKKPIPILYPVVPAGAIMFVLLYILAAIMYPGGSQFDEHSIGFSWMHNYWCNLLNDKAINGGMNKGRYFAMAGMLVLCCTLGWFWYVFALYASNGRYLRVAMQLSGIVSGAVAFFIFTGWHDVIINIAGVSAIIAFAGTLAGLYKLQWRRLFRMGVINVVLVIINNCLYYGNGLAYLPVVQKITFIVFLLWICLISIRQRDVTGTKQKIIA